VGPRRQPILPPRTASAPNHGCRESTARDCADFACRSNHPPRQTRTRPGHCSQADPVMESIKTTGSSSHLPIETSSNQRRRDRRSHNYPCAAPASAPAGRDPVCHLLPLLGRKQKPQAAALLSARMAGVPRSAESVDAMPWKSGRFPLIRSLRRDPGGLISCASSALTGGQAPRATPAYRAPIYYLPRLTPSPATIPLPSENPGADSSPEPPPLRNGLARSSHTPTSLAG
jgi:hypothetical protein